MTRRQLRRTSGRSWRETRTRHLGANMTAAPLVGRDTPGTTCLGSDVVLDTLEDGPPPPPPPPTTMEASAPAPAAPSAAAASSSSSSSAACLLDGSSSALSTASEKARTAQ